MEELATAILQKGMTIYMFIIILKKYTDAFWLFYLKLCSELCVFFYLIHNDLWLHQWYVTDMYYIVNA